jgi:hypothetical protein
MSKVSRILMFWTPSYTALPLLYYLTASDSRRVTIGFVTAPFRISSFNVRLQCFHELALILPTGAVNHHP